jgi:hypothetical protein
MMASHIGCASRPAIRQSNRRPDRRRRRLLAVGLGGALSALVAPDALVRVAKAAAPAGCPAQRPSEPPRIAAPSAAEGLPRPFAFQPWRDDPRKLLGRTAEAVVAQADASGVDACFRSKPASIVERVDLLSPFEFLAIASTGADREERDALLAAYERDPREAIRRLGPLYPSPKGEMLLATLAYYDVDADRIRVNLGMVGQDLAPRVLVHEFWHAMPDARAWDGAGGEAFRATGFWTHERKPGTRTWVPLDDANGLPFPPYLLDEAMATAMETRFAGPPPRPRPDLDAAQRFLDRLMAVAGQADVMRAYLDSRPADLKAMVESHRAELADVLAPVRDAG